MFEIEISEFAEQDIIVSTEFYEDKKNDLGKRFFKEVWLYLITMLLEKFCSMQQIS